MSRHTGQRFASALVFAHALANRPAAPRRWQRTNQHPGHIGCWRGEPRHGGSTYLLCIEPGARTGTVEITTRHESSGHRVLAACRSDVSATSWPTTVRGLIKKLL
jgi:hypothetical protein